MREGRNEEPVIKGTVPGEESLPLMQFRLLDYKILGLISLVLAVGFSAFSVPSGEAWRHGGKRPSLEKVEKAYIEQVLHEEKGN